MQQTKRCASCGHISNAEARFCQNCGGNQFVAPMVLCAACGTLVPQDHYCAHCGADLVNPNAIVWRNCSQCGSLVHITYANCPRCGAPNLPQVPPNVRHVPPNVSQLPPDPPKKSSNAWLALLIIPFVFFMLIGIGLGILDAMQDELPDIYVPYGTTPSSSGIRWHTYPSIPRHTSPSATQPTGSQPTQPQPTKPTPTEPEPTEPEPTEPEPTEPEPTEPIPPESEGNIPDAYKDNHYLSSMDGGYCENMVDSMVVYFLFVNDPTDGWTQAEVSEAEAALLDELRTLLGEAESYGVDLQINYVFDSVNISTEFNRNSDAWKTEALRQAGWSHNLQDQRVMEEFYEASNVPVVFLVDEPGRSFANFYYYGNGFESVTICQKDYTALRHEMCHVFGARDMYFPQETVDAAEMYLPNGIMYGDCRGEVDPLTAFVIGWTDELSNEAIAFLQATNSLTEEYIEQAKQQDQLTGYGTRYFEGGYYEGDMVEGVFHGEGTCYWDDGYVYTGTWVNGVREGYGVMTGTDGYRYEGYWKNNQPHGTGELVLASGDTYTGSFADGKIHGKGTYTWTNGIEYSGDWVNGKREGKGTITWPDGSYYTGDFQNDKFHGKGERYYAEYGTKYVGDFANGKRHGWGIYYYADGRIYEGRWENDVRVD